MDWGGLLKWRNNNLQIGAPSVEVRLEGSPDSIPRTRIITRSPALLVGVSDEVRETILFQDDQAMRCYYVTSDGFMPGIRNYMASGFVDPTDLSRSVLNVRSTFDVTSNGDAEGIKRAIESLYDGIFAGFNRYFASTG